MTTERHSQASQAASKTLRSDQHPGKKQKPAQLYRSGLGQLCHLDGTFSSLLSCLPAVQCAPDSQLVYTSPIVIPVNLMIHQVGLWRSVLWLSLTSSLGWVDMHPGSPAYFVIQQLRWLFFVRSITLSVIYTNITSPFTIRATLSFFIKWVCLKERVLHISNLNSDSQYFVITWQNAFLSSNKKISPNGKDFSQGMWLVWGLTAVCYCFSRLYGDAFTMVRAFILTWQWCTHNQWS